MAYPIVEQIAQDIHNTLMGVQMSAGYSQDLIVARRKQRENKEENNKAILVQGDPQKLELKTNNVIRWAQPYEVWLFATLSETSTIPIDQRLNVLRSDAEKALMVDPHRGTESASGDQLAEDTIIEAPEYVSAADGSWEAVVVHFTVNYRTALDDPYSLS